MTPRSHFRVPQRPDLAREIQEGQFELLLTERSKRLFEEGKPGQGYIGVLDIETGEIHLLPAFNKDDGLLRNNKSGKPFSHFIESTQPLGSMTGDLHTFATSILGLNNKGGMNGKLMGFGIWKAGPAVRFLDEFPSIDTLLPNDLLYIKSTDQYFYIKPTFTHNPEISDVPIYDLVTVPLDKEDFPDLWTAHEKGQAEVEAYMTNFVNDDPESVVEGIKSIKNRSSSQNFFSVKYDEVYAAFFKLHTRNHSVHALNLQREIPFSLLIPIYNKVTSQIGVEPIQNIFDTTLLPGGPAGIRQHIVFEVEWQNSPVKVMRGWLGELVKENDTDKLQMLLDAIPSASNKNMVLSYFSKGPLIAHIIKNNQTEMMQVLINQGLDVNQVFIHAMPIIFAVDKPEMLSFLLNNGLDPLNDAVKNTLISPAYDYVVSGNTECLEILLKNEFDPNQRFSSEATLFTALRSGNKEMVDLLIKYGADPNTKNYNGDTFLHKLIQNDDLVAVRLLLTLNVDLNIKNNQGETPLMAAQRMYAPDIIAAIENAISRLEAQASARVVNNAPPPRSTAWIMGRIPGRDVAPTPEPTPQERTVQEAKQTVEPQVVEPEAHVDADEEQQPPRLR